MTDLKEGDHVLPIFAGECGECAYCKSEKTNLCGKFRVNAFKTGMTVDGKTRFFTVSGRNPIHHFLNTSTFTQYTVLDSACVLKIDPTAPLREICLLSCGVSTGTRLGKKSLLAVKENVYLTVKLFLTFRRWGGVEYSRR